MNSGWTCGGCHVGQKLRPFGATETGRLNANAGAARRWSGISSQSLTERVPRRRLTHRLEDSVTWARSCTHRCQSPARPVFLRWQLKGQQKDKKANNETVRSLHSNAPGASISICRNVENASRRE